MGVVRPTSQSPNGAWCALKRSPNDVETRIYQYRFRPDPIPDAIAQQLSLANDFWNDLVAYEHTVDAQFDAVWRRTPAIDTVYRELEALDQRVAVASPVEKSQITPEYRQLYHELAVLKLAHRDHVAEAFETLSARLNADRRARVKSLRQTYAAKGLYYGTYNDVINRYDKARQIISQARRRHQLARLRFHRFDGAGSLTLQVVQTADKPPLTLALLQVRHRHPYYNYARLSPLADLTDARPATARQHTARPHVMLRMASTPDQQPVWLQGTLILHRRWPTEGAVKSIRWVRERIGTHFRDSLHFTIRTDRTDAVSSSTERLALDIGWRKQDRGLRVAAWASTLRSSGWETLASVEDVHRWTGSAAGELIVPSRIVKALAQVDRLQQIRDQKLNRIRTELAEWLQTHALPAALGEGNAERTPDLTGAAIHRWASAARFATLAIEWRDQRFPGDEAMYERLEAWRREDKHLFEWQANLRDKTLRFRRELYRVFASRVATLYGTVFMEDMNLAAIARKAPPDADGRPRLHADSAQRQRYQTAPSELRRALTWALSKNHGDLVMVPYSKGTRQCTHCGSDNSAVDTARHLRITCSQCGRQYDQDVNVAENLLASRSP